MTRRIPSTRSRRGSVIVIVLWCISVAAIVVSSLQLFAYRQATLGRDVLHRTQARWAARSGVEASIAMLALHTEQPIPDDAFALVRDLEYVWSEQLLDAAYDVIYHADGRDWKGPLDEHAKMNLNGAQGAQFGLLEDITPDVVSALRDWIDEDKDAGLLGAEEDYYESLTSSYKPRNGAMRSVAEMELVAGIWGDFVRGEDWNLNNRLDPNEDDGLRTMPEDEPDGVMEPGWSGRLTVHSVQGGATLSGLPRIDLRRADPEEVAMRCGLEPEQAELVVAFGRRSSNELTQLISTPLTRINSDGSASSNEVNGDIEALTDEQLASVLAETINYPFYERRPGLINLNTASPELIRDLLEAQGIDPVIADEIIYMRDSRAEGLISIVDLNDIPDMQPALLEQLAGLFTTISNVYTISARGRSQVSGAEVEIITVVDRSALPIRILEYREQ
ncbi:MAG: hypothetical protein HKO59_00240 [Phycisphaerales bacterium]|nr:general secretion pathway protein GspK [Phycisphaerae bacterium]NNF44521.1 hypothetical protein [Phycisphaerales bacterium]NNM24410.1 hypothetical protein [Phycisphaerales bacterium]